MAKSKDKKPSPNKPAPKAKPTAAPKEGFMQKAGEEFNKFREKVSPIYRLGEEKKKNGK